MNGLPFYDIMLNSAYRMRFEYLDEHATKSKIPGDLSEQALQTIGKTFRYNFKDKLAQMKRAN